MKKIVSFLGFSFFLIPSTWAAPANVDFIVTMSEAVNVTGCPTNCPRIAVTVDGQTRYATYSAGTGTSSLTFSYAPTIGDLDLDGVALTSPIDLNGGTITDLNGNPETDLTFTVPNTSGIKIDYPSLSMDFVADADGRYTVNGTAYNDLSSFLGATGGTFTRSSVGTYFDSTGTLQTAASGQPRFDHDPVTHTPKGILIEESRSNKLLNSSDFNASGWSRTDITVNSSTGHIYNLQKITEGSAGTALLRQNVFGAFTAGSTTYGSFFVSRGNTDWIVVKINETGAGEIANFWFNIATGIAGSITKTGGSNETAKIIPISSGVYRIIVSFLPNPTSTNRGILISSATSNGSLSRVPGAEYYVSYAQLEQGSFPTSYIPTTSAAVTRAAETMTVPISSWFNNTNGSISFTGDVISSGTEATPGGIAIHSIGNNGYLFYKQAGTLNLYSFVGTGQVNIGAVSSNTLFIAGMAYNTTTAKGALNGVLSAGFTPSSVWLPTYLKTNQAGSWNGHIMKYKFYPTQSSDTQLQLLTQ